MSQKLTNSKMRWVFDGLVRYSTVDPENAIRERITAKLRERRVSHIDLSQCDKNDFEFVKVVNKKFLFQMEMRCSMLILWEVFTNMEHCMLG